MDSILTTLIIWVLNDMTHPVVIYYLENIMDILKTKTVLALGISGAMSIGTAAARVPNSSAEAADTNSIIALSSPDLRVTVYDGIATLVGTAKTLEEAQAAEKEIREISGIEHVINMITWG